VSERDIAAALIEALTRIIDEAVGSLNHPADYTRR
jgi:hypothetical protein